MPTIETQLKLPEIRNTPIPQDVLGTIYPVGDGHFSFSAVLLDEKGDVQAVFDCEDHLSREEAEAKFDSIRTESLQDAEKRRRWFGQ